MRFINASRLTVAALLASSALCAPALAQVGPYPLYRSLDENGVDLVRGDFLMSLKEGSIGSGKGELALIRTSGIQSDHQWDRYTFNRTVSGGSATIRVGMPGGYFEEFTGTTSGSNFTTVKANGAVLSGTNGNYNFTSPDGTRIRFVDLSNSWEIGFASNFCSSLTQSSSCMLAADRITSADGVRVTLAWDVHQVNNNFYDSRIASVSNNLSYSITFAYQTDTWSPPGGTWHIRTGADFRNTAVSPNVQASVAYAYPNGTTLNLTDMASQVWQITDTSIKRPGEASPYFNVTLVSNIVTTVVKDAVTTTYNRVVNGNTVTLTKTTAPAPATIITSDLTKGQPTSISVAGQATSFTYDTSNRLTRVTQPEGNYVEFTLDARGNATQTQQVKKTGASDPPIITSAVYPATCTNTLTCNKPDSTTDARGNVTNYVWDPNHGGISTITRPPPVTNGIRPQTRYTYTPIGSAPIKYLLASISECQTTASCAGAADEVKTTLGYDANGNVTTLSKGNGTGSLTATNTMTYTARGDVQTLDGPLAGTADTSRYRYDAARRIVGAIDPDPDGGSALKHRAVRTTYDVAGRPTKRELGTVNSQSDPDWALFAPLEAIDIGYTNSRVTSQKLSGGGTAKALTQLSYDAAGRPECSAVRMNPAVYASLPASACTLGTQGTDGADRITKTVYNSAGQVSEQRVAVGVTGEEAAERTLTYTNNRKLQTLKDAENNLTTYEYDGHDRLSKTRMPSTTKGSGTSSTTDYEQLTYENTSGGTRTSATVASVRLRDAQVIGFGYDGLTRRTSKDLPGGEWDETFSYDNLNRLTAAIKGPIQHSFTYDALSRQTVEGQLYGSVSRQFDLAGRMTRTTWWDGFYVDYDRMVTGELSKVRENGATSGTGVLATYGYDTLRRRTSLVRGNGTSTSYGYDPVSRLASMTENLVGSPSYLIQTYSYNPASQVTQVNRSNDAFAWTGHGSGSTASVSDGLNRLITFGGIAATSDARGNMTSDPSTGRTFGYFSQNDLRSSGTFGIGYDALLRPADTLNSGAVTKQFTYDGMQIVAASNPGAGIAERYVWGDAPDELLVDYVGSGTTNRRWAHQDERGSVIALSDAAGNAVAINKYDEFGKPQAGNVGRFQYTGQMWMPEVSLYHYKARVYSPTFGGRFLQTDPIGYAGGVNLYAYVSNDPVNFADPLGLQGEPPPQPPPCGPGVGSPGCEVIVTGPGIQCPPGSYMIQGRCYESAAAYMIVLLGPSWTSTQGSSGTAAGGGLLHDAALQGGAGGSWAIPFGRLRYHWAKHGEPLGTDSPEEYHQQAMTNVEVGTDFRFTIDGQQRLAHITRVGNMFVFTSTNLAVTRIYTHMLVDQQYLSNKGITLPRGF